MRQGQNQVTQLVKKEPIAVTKSLAFMSYNPSIGRVLSKKGVKKFEKMAEQISRTLVKIKNYEDFDKYHNRWVENFRQKIKTNTGTKCTYGQAQKAINVFLKVYVDWASRPSWSLAETLRRFLHVPLDRILMDNIKKQYPDFFNKKIMSYRSKSGNYQHSLSKIQRDEYNEWQKFFRRKAPKKPVVFDVIWAIER